MTERDFEAPGRSLAIARKAWPRRRIRPLHWSRSTFRGPAGPPLMQRSRPVRFSQTTMELPRLFPEPETGVVEMESRLPTAVEDEFAQRGFTVRAAKSPIGGSQAIWINWKNGVLIGASDHRKDGFALGY